MKKASLFISATVAAAGAVIAVYSSKGNIRKTPLEVDVVNGLAEKDTSLAPGADIRIMSANLLAHYKSRGGEEVKPRAKIFMEVIMAYKPDVMAVQEVCGDWMRCLSKNMPHDYVYVNGMSDAVHVNLTGLIYNSETLKLIDGGSFKYEQGDNPRLRRISWGVFEVIADGRRFAVTSTHLNVIREENKKKDGEIMKSQAAEQIDFVKSLEKDYICPVFAAGDFNCHEASIDSVSVYDVLKDNMKNTKTVSENTPVCTGGDKDEPTPDHIFSRGLCSVKSWIKLSDNYMNKMSDHYPLIVDVKV